MLQDREKKDQMAVEVAVVITDQTEVTVSVTVIIQTEDINLSI